MTIRLASGEMNTSTTIRCEPEMDVKWLNGWLTVSVTVVGFGLVLLKGF